jgi:hypothetical protein
MSEATSDAVPLHSVDVCSICGCGLCGIRICGFDTDKPHGLVVCDECEALWTQPDTRTPHMWRDAEHPHCPICDAPLWGAHSRWATREDLEKLGWQQQINPHLNAEA